MSQLCPHYVINDKMFETLSNLEWTFPKDGAVLVTLLRFDNFLYLLDKLVRFLGIEVQPMMIIKFAASGSLLVYSDGGLPNPASILTDFSIESFKSLA